MFGSQCLGTAECNEALGCPTGLSQNINLDYYLVFAVYLTSNTLAAFNIFYRLLEEPESMFMFPSPKQSLASPSVVTAWWSQERSATVATATSAGTCVAMMLTSLTTRSAS